VIGEHPAAVVFRIKLSSDSTHAIPFLAEFRVNARWSNANRRNRPVSSQRRKAIRANRLYVCSS
jgi:hypothetical protein